MKKTDVERMRFREPRIAQIPTSQSMWSSGQAGGKSLKRRSGDRMHEEVRSAKSDK